MRGAETRSWRLRDGEGRNFLRSRRSKLSRLHWEDFFSREETATWPLLRQSRPGRVTTAIRFTESDVSC